MEAEPTGGGKSTGSIAERRAARCGFKPTPRLNTARFRSVSPLSSPAVRSPFLTIPPGISPTALLDSPVTLLNPQVLPSPTTGSFQILSVEHESMSQVIEDANAGKDDHGNVTCSFMLRNQPIAPISISSLQNADSQMESEDHRFIHKKEGYTEELQLGGVAKTATVEAKCIVILHSESKQTRCPDESLNGEDFLSQQLFEEDQSAEFATVIGRPSEDGYNWRKYGQKQVKGSEFPRSYYKCTYPSCQVKKKVECSFEGQITEIFYKGTHHHPKPQPTRRSAFSSSYSISELSGSAIGLGPSINVEGESVGRNSQQESKEKIGVNLKAQDLEWASSTSAVTELSDTCSPAQAKCSRILIEHPEFSSTLASQVTYEDDATLGSMMIGDDGEDDDDEFESKRRKGENCLVDSNPVPGSARGPRVVVQTVSESDILDDGYRWRKYGQKVVKGNPNPRSYYKCTHPECSVRKLVERASHDLRSVITTYEGKHNHEVPRARNSNHISAGSKSQTASNSRPSTILIGSTSISKLEKSQNLYPSCHENYELLSYRGSGSADPCIRAFPSLQPLSFGFLASKANWTEADLSFPVSNFDPNLPIQMPISFVRPNIAFCDYRLNDQLRTNAGEVQPLHRQQQPMDGEMRFSMQPLQEQDDADNDSPGKNFSDAGLSICHWPMNRFPG